MASLKNLHKAPLGVQDSDKNRVEIAPGKTAEVKGSFSNHPFVKAGWLESSETAKQSGRKSEPKQDQKDEASE